MLYGYGDKDSHTHTSSVHATRVFAAANVHLILIQEIKKQNGVQETGDRTAIQTRMCLQSTTQCNENIRAYERVCPFSHDIVRSSGSVFSSLLRRQRSLAQKWQIGAAYAQFFFFFSGQYFCLF